MVALKIGGFINEASADCGGQYKEILCGNLNAEQLSKKLTESYRNLIKLTMADTTLHMMAVVPLYTAEFAAQLQLLQQACRQTADKLSLHVIGLRGNLARLFSEENNAEVEKGNIELLDKQSVEGVFPYSFTIVDDYVASGAALDFTLNSFSEYLALLFSALIQNYYAVLPPALLAGGLDRNISIGLASLRFDRKLACQALLNGAFIGALDKVNINQETVNATVASQRATTILQNIDKRYPIFFDKYVLPQFRDAKKEESQIVADVEKPLAEEMQSIEKMLTAVLKDPELSFPEKETVISLILGRDNPRLQGVQFDRTTMLLDDACSEPIDQYINVFNDGPVSTDALPVRGDFEELKKYEWDESTNKYVESPENRKAFNPLSDIKRLKLEILNQTAFIRRKEAELGQLKEIDDKRRNTEEGLENKTDDIERYRLPASIKEQPLDQTYHPSSSVKPKKSVDLRKFFSPIKSQGSLGSCSTFAVVSMYEAIMNRYAGENQQPADLSERFVYYFSNVLTGRPEGGSNYYEQLGVLGKHGVCEEKLFNYTTSDLDKAPTDEAVEDAQQHRVLQAMQIPLQTTGNVADCLKKNHELLTTALSEGFPVGISLKIYDSFGENGPFISRPDQDDISSGGEGYHAMVLAGYSEADKCYIVRNSWSNRFGDNGYGYISAAYIDDPEYNSFACIITQTTETERGQGAEVPQLVASFAGTEAQIREAAIRNILDEAYVTLNSLKKRYEEHYKYYQQLIQKLCVPQVRNELRKSAEEGYRKCFNNLSAERESKLHSFVEEFKKYKRDYLKGAIGLSALTLVCDLSALSALAFGTIDWGTLWVWIIAGVMTLLTVITWLNYRWAKKRKHRELDEEIEELTVNESRARADLREAQLRFHVAGMWLDSFHDLSLNMSRLYDRFVSFNSNLHGWYVDAQTKISTKPDRKAPMFIYYEDRDLLQNYFNDHAMEILASIDLLSTFDNYAIDSETIQQARERLEAETLEAIAPLFKEFRMADYLLGREYPYLQPVRLDEEIARLVSVGQPSVRNSATDPAAPLRLVMLNLTDGQVAQWQNQADRCFPYRPTILSTEQTDCLNLLTVQPLPVDALR
jgi:C1A family cysteine protease